MKNIITITIVFVLSLQVWAQKTTSLKYFDGKVGYSFISPTERTSKNSVVFFQYNHLIKYQTRKDQPAVGLLLNPAISWTGNYKDSSMKYYNLLQPGLASFVPRFYVFPPAKGKVKLYAFGQAGLKYLPISHRDNNNQRIYKGYTQWQAGFGIGIRHLEYFEVEGAYIYAKHNLSDQDEKYFVQKIDSSSQFNAIQVNAKFNLYEGNCLKPYVTLGWSGFVRDSYLNQSFWTIGFGIRPILRKRTTGIHKT